MKRKFAVFDIDGTIYRGAFFLDIAEALVNSGALSKDYRETVAETKANWHNRTHRLAYKEYSDTLVKIWQDHVSELPETIIEELAEKLVTPKKNYVYTYTRDLLKELQAKNYFTIALSGSFQELIEPFCKYYGFDVFIGEQTIRENGKLTNKVVQITYTNKDKIVNNLVSEHGLTLKDSFAVGDSFNDASMLALVENPIAFNPEHRLFEEAQKNKWTIVVERKNTIYKLEPKDGSYILAQAD